MNPSISEYRQNLRQYLTELPADETTETVRYLCRTDLFFLIREIFNRPDFEHQWLFDRCREVQAEPNGYLDLWAREHRKSTIITFGLTIQSLLASHGDCPLPEWRGHEPTVGIFSHTRPIAKKFLAQIRFELETNKRLQDLFPDILYKNPRSEAPKWSLDDGIVIKRKRNPKEASIEAWGLVDGQPTGAHFDIRVYDDVVTRASVTSPDMINKTTEAWELSDNLGTDIGVERYIGTRYNYNDTYRTMLDRGAAKPRIYPATIDGTVNGDPVLLPREVLDKKRRNQGPFVFACQQLLNPKADEKQGFNKAWLRYYDDASSGKGMNIYILVDPASQKKKTSDYTSLWVIGLAADGNYYALDVIRDRLSLTERAELLFSMHRKWKPSGVGYERYGLQADVEHMEDRMERDNYRFRITELGGPMGNLDRVRRLIPTFEQGLMWLPRTLHKTNYEGKVEDMVDVFINQEYLPFPVGIHADMLDSLSRIHDKALKAIFPMHKVRKKLERNRDYQPGSQGWMR